MENSRVPAFNHISREQSFNIEATLLNQINSIRLQYVCSIKRKHKAYFVFFPRSITARAEQGESHSEPAMFLLGSICCSYNDQRQQAFPLYKMGSSNEVSEWKHFQLIETTPYLYGFSRRPPPSSCHVCVGKPGWFTVVVNQLKFAIFRSAITTLTQIICTRWLAGRTVAVG